MIIKIEPAPRRSDRSVLLNCLFLGYFAVVVLICYADIRNGIIKRSEEVRAAIVQVRSIADDTKREIDAIRAIAGTMPFDAVASFYSYPFHLRRTANGEIYDQDGFTVAHKFLPFGTILIIRNPENDRAVLVRVNDRGPFIANRDLDLSRGAAMRLDMIRVGVGRVIVQIVKLGG